jgi:hypothetical protein
MARPIPSRKIVALALRMFDNRPIRARDMRRLHTISLLLPCSIYLIASYPVLTFHEQPFQQVSQF